MFRAKGMGETMETNYFSGESKGKNMEHEMETGIIMHSDVRVGA